MSSSRSSSRLSSYSSASSSSAASEDSWQDANDDLASFISPSTSMRQRDVTIRGHPMTGKLMVEPDVVIERPRSRSSSTKKKRRGSSASSSLLGVDVPPVPDLNLLDIDELLAAVSGPSPSWPSPPACLGLAPPWAPTEPSTYLSPSYTPRSYDEDFDPERTPRPLQGGPDQTPRAPSYEEHSPIYLPVEHFPAPPTRREQPRDSFFLAEDAEDEDEDEEGDEVSELGPSPLASPTKSSPGSRRSSRSTGSQCFRWSSGTASTVLTTPSTTNRHSSGEEMIKEEDHQQPRLPYFDAYPLRAPSPSSTASTTSTRSTKMSRAASEPIVRTLRNLRADDEERAARRSSGSEAPEWMALVDALYAEPQRKPSPPLSIRAVLAATTTPPPILRRMASTASIASANPMPPQIASRTTSLSPRRVLMTTTTVEV